MKIKLTSGRTIEIDTGVWIEVASSATSGSMLGAEYVAQRLVLARHADGRQIVTGEFVEGTVEHTLRSVIKVGLVSPPVIDLVGGCLRHFQKA
jgi:hypothetical protein